MFVSELIIFLSARFTIWGPDANQYVGQLNHDSRYQKNIKRVFDNESMRDSPIIGDPQGSQNWGPQISQFFSQKINKNRKWKISGALNLGDLAQLRHLHHGEPGIGFSPRKDFIFKLKVPKRLVPIDELSSSPPPPGALSSTCRVVAAARRKRARPTAG